MRTAARSAAPIALAALVLLAAAPLPALADGDPANGEKLFRQCKACHTVEAGKNRVGPTLHGLFGRKAGTVDTYANYSEGLKASGIAWDAKTLDPYLANPKAVIADSRMAFAGVAKPEDRADLIAYLESATK
ncbi:cytochrome C [Azospirillum sp. TSH58]|uniref:c-type cytochrome n=1 Tax=Azospirillum sp. TSH58 TaxID=664962 RepID=UPI000D6020C5|nr:cytochrome c family protein [Azospirillum sp. TSH58]AWJ83632.1 cytochrome C [Azospirillum sp. TSH58]PWC70263.1 cytochrome C [Azospirillum sp. TSH58]